MVDPCNAISYLFPATPIERLTGTRCLRARRATFQLELPESSRKYTSYLPEEVERQICKASEASRVSGSKWVVDRVGKSLETSWPAEFLALGGAFPDFPDAETLR